MLAGISVYRFVNKPGKASENIGSEKQSSEILQPNDPQSEVTGSTESSIAFSGKVNPDEYVAFAKTLIGTPYLYGSSDPARGFDCSGFINYVSNHFGVKVPRSSVDFTNFGKTVEKKDARLADLILFMGTDSTSRVVGHIGIITDVKHDNIEFIHSSSGKVKGVVISDLSGYYDTRFMKIVRIIE